MTKRIHGDSRVVRMHPLPEYRDGEWYDGREEMRSVQGTVLGSLLGLVAWLPFFVLVWFAAAVIGGGK